MYLPFMDYVPGKIAEIIWGVSFRIARVVENVITALLCGLGPFWGDTDTFGFK